MNARILLLLGAVGLSGCAAAAQYPSAERSGPVIVSVANHNWAMVRVYLVPQDGRPVRLGTVETAGVARFALPRTLIQQGATVSFQIYPLAGGFGYETGTVMVWPGRVVRLTVENHLPLSSLVVAR